MLHDGGYAGIHTPHGFRSSFSTVMNDRHPKLGHVIDFALGHVPKDKVERAYNRAEYLDQRRIIMQEYADLIMAGLQPAEVLIKLPQR